MPKININKSSPHSVEDTYNRVKAVMANDSDLKKLDSSYACEFSDSTKSIKANGKTFKADLVVSGDASGAKVAVVVDLPLMLTPFKGMVEATLGKKLDKALG